MGDDLRMRTGLLALVIFAAACGSSKPLPPPPSGTEPPPPSPPPVVVDEPPPDPADRPTTGQCEGPPPAPDYVCMQHCGPPVGRAGDPPPGWGWASPESAESRRLHGCPICLPAEARIATPRGEIEVASLREGDPIWTLDGDGRRIAATVVLVASTPVARNHALVRITLADGRRVAASGPHPARGGVPLAHVAVGDALDGSIVTRVESLAYDGSHTYDVLPSGPTGAYWADGVVLESTL